MSIPTVVPIVTQLHPISNFLKNHEKLFLLAIAGLVLWFGIGKIDTLIQNHDNANLQQAKVVAQVQQEKNEALATQATQQAAQYKELADKVQVQNAALEQSNVALATALTKQQQKDSIAPMSDLVTRWEALVPNVNFDGAPMLANGGIGVNPANARLTVQQLELVPVQQQELVNARKEAANDLSLLTASTGQVTTLTSQVTGLQLLIVDNSKVCDARVKVETDKIHKARRRWFKIGFATGFLTRQAIKTYAGV